MQTYFIRHTENLDVDDATRAHLWDNNLIAIHFPENGPEDTRSLDPADYGSPGRKALTRLLELARDGGFVCAQHHGQEEVQIGFVPPGSEVNLLVGRWGRMHGNQGREAILKSLRLHSPTTVRPVDYAAIHVGRPRQGTLNRWPSVGSLIRDLVEGASARQALESLSYPQQEILCS